jgi:SNF2 family DNA or RNA helicase
MKLDYFENTGNYVLYKDKRETDLDLSTLRDLHGFDHSLKMSTGSQDVFYTPDMYCAATFASAATPRAFNRLEGIVNEIEQSWLKESGAHIDTPQDKELWPFQVAGVEYALRRKNTLIGDQPGLGKTAQAVCIANEMRAKKVLVICPANIRLQWAKAIREWSTRTDKYIIYPILKSANGVHPRADWTIISYDLARGEVIHELLMQHTYDLCVIDEAHYLKTPSAKRTVAIFGNSITQGLSERCGAVVGLTGTPLPNRPQECYTLTRAMCWDAIDWMSEEQFSARYNPREVVEKWDANKNKTIRYSQEATGRLPELQNRLRSNFMVRRKKRDVMTQLPAVSHEIVYVEETGAVKRALKAESMLDIDPTDLSNTGDFFGEIATIRREMGVATAPGVADYVDMLLAGGVDKVLVLAWHHEVMDILQTKLEKWGVIRIDGKVSAARKEIFKNRFIDIPDQRVLIGQLQSIGTGTDGIQLVCSRAVFAECDWVPGNNFDQGVGRLDRGGQTDPVLAEFLMAQGSFIEKIMKSALEKLVNINGALDKEHF